MLRGAEIVSLTRRVTLWPSLGTKETRRVSEANQGRTDIASLTRQVTP